MLSDNGFIDDKVACIAKPVLMFLKHHPFKSPSRLFFIRKSAPKRGCLIYIKYFLNSVSSFDTVFFYYSSRLLLDDHHLSTDNIKVMSQQVIIARLMRRLDSGIELS